MGLAIVFAVILGVFGLGALFVAPWLGGALLLAAVFGGVAGIFWLRARSDELVEREEPEAPHMPGPKLNLGSSFASSTKST